MDLSEQKKVKRGGPWYAKGTAHFIDHRKDKQGKVIDARPFRPGKTKRDRAGKRGSELSS
jgi:hypothetical protein